jgi:CheY-like chemotaxis protein
VRPVVLVVEDDPLVRLSALDMVEDLGFSATPAAAAGEALDILKTDGRVDILFTDIGLPDMRGHELARTALALRPELKVVFASGYADDGSAPEGAVWLAKPYEQTQLSSVLARLSGSWSPQRSA